MLEVAMKSAAKWLTAKRTILDKGIIEFLVAVAEKDMIKASASLKQVCEGTRKEGDVAKMRKIFCRYAHGLYNFAYSVLPRECFDRLEQPDDKGFLNDFAQWNIDNGFPQGKLYFPCPKSTVC